MTKLQVTGYRLKVSWLVASLLVTGWLVGCGSASVDSDQSSVNSVPTVDPFIAVESAQRTAEAAQEEADFYSRQLTATAEAPIVAITQTAAAFEMQMMFAQATAQSVSATETVAVTQTAMAWTATPNATSTMVAAQSIAEATQIANDTEIDNLMVERARSTNTMRAMAGYVVGFIALLGALMFVITFAKRFAVIPNPTNEQGKPVPMLDVVEGSVVDIDRATNGVMNLKQGFVKRLPAITAERQDVVTNRAQLVDMKTRTKVTSAAVAKLLEGQTGKHVGLEAGTSSAGMLEGGLFPLPQWDLLNSWNGEKNALPYGITMKGLGLLNVENFPHLATIGMTGGGKSRRFFRPLIACALAAGHRVVVIGKTTDYFVFAGHPNVTTVKISQMTEPRHAERYAAILKALVQEMNRRDDYLSTHHHSTWAHAGRERTFIILDELGNALRLMPSNLSEQARIWVEGLVSEGRKVGFNVAVANQRATGMAGILSQTGKAIFRVERDEEKAHKSLSGASDLRDGYFYARFGDVQLAGAFEPSDAEIVQMLNARQTTPLEPDWVDATVLTSFNSALPLTPGSPLIEEKADITPEEAEQVTELLKAGETPSSVVRAIWQVSGGGKFLRLNDAVKKIKDGLAEGAMA